MKHVNKTTEQDSDSLPYNDMRFQFYYFTVVEFYFNNIYRRKTYNREKQSASCSEFRSTCST